MAEMAKNPFNPIELWVDTMITVKDGEEEKRVDAKHYHVRYVVGESEDKTFVDAGDGIEPVQDKTLYTAPSVHRMTNDPFHFDRGSVQRITGSARIENSKPLDRVDACGDHEMVEVAFESPGVECCAMSKEEADRQSVPLKYMSGYLLGKSDGYIKLALSKTIPDTGSSYFENIHIIPEAVVRSMDCLE